jgi:hypothetical protein
MIPHFPAKFGKELQPIQKAMASHIRMGQKSSLLRKSRIGRVKIATPKLDATVAQFNPKPGVY